MGDKKDRSIGTISMTFQQKRPPSLFEEVAFEIHPGAYPCGLLRLRKAGSAFVYGTGGRRRPLRIIKCRPRPFGQSVLGYHTDTGTGDPAAQIGGNRHRQDLAYAHHKSCLSPGNRRL